MVWSPVLMKSRVYAKWYGYFWIKEYYPGRIAKLNIDGTYNINFDDGDK